MSVAKRIANVEPIQADWLTIEDEDSLVHRYAKRGLADIKTPAHIECFCIPQKGSQAELVRDRDGKTTLRQEDRCELRGTASQRWATDARGVARQIRI